MPKLTEEQKKARRWHREYAAKQRKEWRHVGKKGDVFGLYRCFPLFGSYRAADEKRLSYDTRIFVSEGGWLIGRRWMSTRELEQALERWVRHSYSTALPEAVTEGGAYQCGGCRFFGALDGDYGLCCNPASAEDGRVVFEHGGCPKHSYVREVDA